MRNMILTVLISVVLAGCSATQSAKMQANLTDIEATACAVAPHASTAVAVANVVVNSPSLVPSGTDQAKAALAAQYASQGLATLSAMCAKMQGLTPATPVVSPAPVPSN